MAIEKTIKIGTKDVRMKASADTPRVYRHLFKRDIFQDIQKIMAGKDSIGDTEVLENIAYVMAKAADKNIPEIREWLADFNMFDIYKAFPDIMKLWGMNTKSSSIPKKKHGKR